MPALLSTILDFKSEPLGIALAPYLPDDPTLQRMLAQASGEAEAYCNRRLIAPPGTTLGATASSGTASVTVSDISNIHEGDVVVFPDGATIEVFGADAQAWPGTGPVAGTVTLASKTSTTYSSGAAVTVYRQSRYTAKGRASTNIDSMGANLSQQGQIALAHAPKLGTAAFARKVFVPEYPLWSVNAAFYTLPWAGQTAEVTADVSNITIFRQQGWFQLPVGFPNFQGSMWRVQYDGGFKVVPQDIRDAVHNLLAAEIAKAMNPVGAMEIRADGQMVRMTRQSMSAGTPVPASMFVEDAHRKLNRYRRRGV